jgi:hypothetical protein
MSRIITLIYLITSGYLWVIKGLTPCFWCALTQLLLVMSLGYDLYYTNKKYSIGMIAGAWFCSGLAWVSTTLSYNVCFLTETGYLNPCQADPSAYYGFPLKSWAFLGLSFLLLISLLEKNLNKEKRNNANHP